MWRNWNSCTLLVGMESSEAPLENIMDILIKLDTELPHDLAIPLLGIYMKEMKQVSKRYLYTYVHSSVIYRSQRWKQPKCLSVDEEIKQNVVYTSSGLLSLKKKGYSDVCYNMDES